MIDKLLKRKTLRILTVIIAAVTIFLCIGLFKLRFDYDFEKFYPKEDSDTAFFEEYRKKFNSDNDYLLIAIERKAGIFDEQFLKQVDKFSKDLETAPYVEMVAGITNQDHFYLLPGGMYSKQPIIHFDSLQLEQDSIRLFNAPEYVNTMVAKNGTSICLFVKHQDYLSKAKCDELIRGIEKVKGNYNFENVRLAGRAIGQAFYIEKMNFELILFAALSGLLTAIFLFFTFRNIWGVAIPMIILASTVFWTMGIMGWDGTPINILLTTLPTVLFIVSISDVVHLVSRYLDAQRAGQTSDDAIKVSLKEVGFATFLTSITTTIGFFCLLFVNLQPIQSFGFNLGFGVMIAFILAVLMLPVLVHYFPAKVRPKDAENNVKWVKFMSNLWIFVFKHKKSIVIGTLLICVISTYGVMQIKANNYFMDDMKKTEPLKMDFNYFDEHYGGIRPFEMAVILKDTSASFWDPEVLDLMDKVEAFLEEDYQVEIKQSLVQMLKVANKASYAGQPEYYVLPESPSKIKQFKRLLTSGPSKEIIRSVMDSTGTVTRISGGIGDIGNVEASKRTERLNTFLSTLDNPNLLEFKITGSSYLMDKNMNYLATSLTKGIISSILLVGLIMGLVFRSVRMAILSVIPNMIPILMVAAVMGYCGIPLRTSTAIIFTIAFGIAVDDTIHLLGKFKHQLDEGKSKLYALKRAYMVTGKAMIITTIILCSGFLLLMFSSFQGTFFLGLLLCLTLLFAIIFDLLLVPILIVYFYKPRKKKTS